MMIDYSEAFLSIDRSLRTVYEYMLKGKTADAVCELEKIADVAKLTAAWIESNDTH